VFTDASHKYSNDPIIHMPNAPPTRPQRELTESPRVSPSPLGSSPPRVHTTTISPSSPSTLPSREPTSVQKSLFSPDVPSVGPRQNIAKQQLGTAPRLPPNTSSISHLEISTPTTPNTRQIIPHVPSLQLIKLWQSLQIANLGILDDKLYPVNGPAHNTCSQTQVRTITQEALLSCIHNYGKVMSHPVMAPCAAQRQYPTNCSMLFLTKPRAISWK
jgi:hypothetical protein